jgi:hypothetical protein
MPLFYGKNNENVTSWLTHVEMVFNAQGIQANQTNDRIHYAATGFRDAALAWWQTHLNANNNAHNQADWATFKTTVTN